MPAVNPYDKIRPNKNKPAAYDLVGKYDWTSVPRTAPLRDEAPAAFITAYELEYSALRTFIDGYMNVLAPQNQGGNYATSKNPGLDFYKGLYAVGKTPIARFSFPYFTDNIRAFSTEFSDTFSPISQRGAKMLGGDFVQGLGESGESLIGGAAAAITQFGHLGNTGGKSLVDKLAKNTQAAVGKVGETFFKAMGVENPGMQTIGAPGTYIETPKFYQYSNTDNTLDIGFALSNTLNEGAIEQNYKFIKDFTAMNRPFRTGPIGMTFPAIYQIVVPGVRYIQWAFLSDFNIGMIGSRRKIAQPNGRGGCKIVPEAYSCQFSFRSLTVEAANFLDELEKYCNLGQYHQEMTGFESEMDAMRETRDRALPSHMQTAFDAAGRAFQTVEQKIANLTSAQHEAIGDAAADRLRDEIRRGLIPGGLGNLDIQQQRLNELILEEGMRAVGEIDASTPRSSPNPENRQGNRGYRPNQRFDDEGNPIPGRNPERVIIGGEDDGDPSNDVGSGAIRQPGDVLGTDEEGRPMWPSSEARDEILKDEVNFEGSGHPLIGEPLNLEGAHSVPAGSDDLGLGDSAFRDHVGGGITDVGIAAGLRGEGGRQIQGGADADQIRAELGAGVESFDSTGIQRAWDLNRVPTTFRPDLRDYERRVALWADVNIPMEGGGP